MILVDDTFFDETRLDKAFRLQSGLLAEATGKKWEAGSEAYIELRRFFANQPDIKAKIPDFVRRCSDLGQFWAFIQPADGTYKGRRTLIWNAFRPLIEYLEAENRTPGVATITEALQAFDADNIHAVWQKALDRRADDPEGAITAARAMLESVCKHVLDGEGPLYKDDADLPKLWAMAAERLNLAPSQHQEEVFKAILGNCQSIVNYLGAIRNKIGDAHGQGRKPVRPKARHAELVVNLAGAMAAFLVATLKEREEKP